MDFFTALEATDFEEYAYFQETLRPMLEQGPFELGPPFWEGLGKGLFEIRWARYRIYCSVEDPKTIVLYLGVKKSWRTFLAEHRKTCERGRTDYLTDAYDQQARHYRYLAYCKKRE